MDEPVVDEGVTGDQGGIEIEELALHLGLGPLLASWHVEEWQHLYERWDLPAALAEFAAMTEPGRVPTTLVAFDGSGRAASDVLGSISLVAHDDLPGFEHLTPWLASLYVVPAARGRGLGHRLVHEGVALARRMGIERLHLFTAGQEGFYRPLGWRTIARAAVRDGTAAVMVLDIGPLAPGA